MDPRGAPTIALACLALAGMAALARSMSGRLPVGELIFLRFTVGLVPVLAAFAVQRRLPLLRRPRLLALRGFLGGLSVTGYFLCIERLPVGPATLLNNTYPAWATLCAALFLGERLRRRGVLGLLLAMAGAAVVVADAVARYHWGLGVGVAGGLLSAVLAGGALTSMRALRSDTDSLTVLFSFSLIGAILSAPLAALSWQPPSGAVLWTSVGVGLLSVVGQFLLSYGYKYVPVSVGSATGLLTTVFSWALGALLLGEGITAQALAGALLCAAGVGMTAQGT
ncbi:MAG TPA: DMT family transporter [Myxococcales bacterium]|nr:DMT family transporter [Myxococcales bacterium]